MKTSSDTFKCKCVKPTRQSALFSAKNGDGSQTSCIGEMIMYIHVLSIRKGVYQISVRGHLNIGPSTPVVSPRVWGSEGERGSLGDPLTEEQPSRVKITCVPW